MTNPTRIFIDADACPVKDETYRVAARFGLKTVVVANQWLNVPPTPAIEMRVVDGGFDAADDWIATNVTPRDVVITADVLLAERCVKAGARALDPKGEEFTPDNIGDRVATRELMQNLRHMGEMRGGPKPMDKQARSRFLGTLDRILQALKRS